jgi:hypothetical protein
MDATMAGELRKEADRHHCEPVYRMRWNGIVNGCGNNFWY